MAQIIDPLPPERFDKVLCCYVNATSKIQIARITNVPNWYFERVVFPGQRLIFEAIPYALLEIHTGMMASAILSDTIPCERLCVESEDEPEVESEIKSETGAIADDKAQPKAEPDSKPPLMQFTPGSPPIPSPLVAVAFTPAD